MSNPILNQMKQNQPKIPQMRNNPIQILNEFKKFANSMNGKNPKQMVMNLLESGEMSKSQYEELLEQAKQLQGFLKF